MANYIDPAYILSITNKYNKTVKKYIVEKLLEKRIITKQPSKEYPNSIDVSAFSDEEQILTHCINTANKQVLKELELWEFESDYVYSILYKIDNFDEEVFMNKIEELGLKRFNIEDDDLDDLQHAIQHPVILIDSNPVLFKFPLQRQATHPQNGNALYLKYPIIAAIHKDIKVLEIRFNDISSLFLMEKSKDFYSKNIRSLKGWFRNQLGFTISNLLLDEKINNLANGDTIIVDGKFMVFSDGSRACLELGKNDTLPLLDELKNIISNNQEEFDKEEVSTVKQLLTTFIQEKEDEADNKWICLCWKGETRSQNIKVKFTFDYIGDDQCLLFHYSGPIGMERMNHVTRSIV